MRSPDLRRVMLSGEKYQQRKPKLLITIEQGKKLKQDHVVLLRSKCHLNFVHILAVHLTSVLIKFVKLF